MPDSSLSTILSSSHETAVRSFWLSQEKELLATLLKTPTASNEYIVAAVFYQTALGRVRRLKELDAYRSWSRFPLYRALAAGIAAEFGLSPVIQPS